MYERTIVAELEVIMLFLIVACLLVLGFERPIFGQELNQLSSQSPPSVAKVNLSADSRPTNVVYLLGYADGYHQGYMQSMRSHLETYTDTIGQSTKARKAAVSAGFNKLLARLENLRLELIGTAERGKMEPSNIAQISKGFVDGSVLGVDQGGSDAVDLAAKQMSRQQAPSEYDLARVGEQAHDKTKTAIFAKASELNLASSDALFVIEKMKL